MSYHHCPMCLRKGVFRNTWGHNNPLDEQYKCKYCCNTFTTTGSVGSFKVIKSMKYQESK